MSQDNVSVSVVIPLLQGVLHFLRKIPATEAGIIRDEIVKQLEKRFKAIVENKNVILATVLDPRFKADFLKAETLQDVQSLLLGNTIHVCMRYGLDKLLHSLNDIQCGNNTFHCFQMNCRWYTKIFLLLRQMNQISQ